jgi:hypothetical protein
MDAATGLNQFSQKSRLSQVFQNLAGCGINVERNPVVHLLAVHQFLALRLFPLPSSYLSRLLSFNV